MKMVMYFLQNSSIISGRFQSSLKSEAFIAYLLASLRCYDVSDDVMKTKRDKGLIFVQDIYICPEHIHLC